MIMLIYLGDMVLSSQNYIHPYIFLRHSKMLTHLKQNFRLEATFSGLNDSVFCSQLLLIETFPVASQVLILDMITDPYSNMSWTFWMTSPCVLVCFRLSHCFGIMQERMIGTDSCLIMELVFPWVVHWEISGAHMTCQLWLPSYELLSASKVFLKQIHFETVLLRLYMLYISTIVFH